MTSGECWLVVNPVVFATTASGDWISRNDVCLEVKSGNAHASSRTYTEAPATLRFGECSSLMLPRPYGSRLPVTITVWEVDLIAPNRKLATWRVDTASVDRAVGAWVDLVFTKAECRLEVKCATVEFCAPGASARQDARVQANRVAAVAREACDRAAMAALVAPLRRALDGGLDRDLSNIRGAGKNKALARLPCPKP